MFLSVAIFWAPNSYYYNYNNNPCVQLLFVTPQIPHKFFSQNFPQPKFQPADMWLPNESERGMKLQMGIFPHTAGGVCITREALRRLSQHLERRPLTVDVVLLQWLARWTRPGWEPKVKPQNDREEGFLGNFCFKGGGVAILKRTVNLDVFSFRTQGLYKYVQLT